MFGLLLFVGCATSSVDQGSADELPSLLERAQKSYLQGVGEKNKDEEKLKQARRYAEKYLDGTPDGAHADRAWYRIAQVEFHRTNYRNVLQAVENGLRRTEQPEVRAALQFMKGKAYGALDRENRALTAYRKARELIESSPSAIGLINRVELDYLISGMLARSGEFDRARDRYRSVIETYPDTVYAKNARDRLRFMKDYFSVQLGVFENQKNAVSLQQDLQKEGFDAYILSDSEGGSTIYSVRLGRYDTLKQARNLKQRLGRNGWNAIVKP